MLKIFDHLVIVASAYNAGDLSVRCINSFKAQKHNDFTFLLVDDASEDDTINKVRMTIKDDSRFRYIINDSNKGSIYSHTRGLESFGTLPDETIVIFFDGDDFLLDQECLDKLLKAHDLYDVVYGQYLTYDVVNNKFTDNLLQKEGIFKRGDEYPQYIKDTMGFRQHRWMGGKPITFKYKIWKEIDQQIYFKHDGEWIPVVTDHAILFALMEAAKGNVVCVKEPLAAYSRLEKPGETSYHVKKSQQQRWVDIIRNQKAFRSCE